MKWFWAMMVLLVLTALAVCVVASDFAKVVPVDNAVEVGADTSGDFHSEVLEVGDITYISQPNELASFNCDASHNTDSEGFGVSRLTPQINLRTCYAVATNGMTNFIKTNTGTKVGYLLVGH